MKTYAQIAEEMKPILADILGLEPEEVIPTARSFEDLDGESIDILETSFRLEKQFDVKLSLSRFGSSDELAVDATGHLTPEALAWLRAQYPFLDLTGFELEPRRDRISELLTVDALTHFVLAAIEHQQARSPGYRPGTIRPTTA